MLGWRFFGAMMVAMFVRVVTICDDYDWFCAENVYAWL